jgi:hypothetical protein
MRVRTHESWLKFILRFNGVFATFAIVAVLMPQSWLVWCVSHVEPGLQVGLLVSYLARALSLYAFLMGLLFLVFANDVRRYRVPISIIAVWCLFAIACFGLYVIPSLSALLSHWFFWFIVGDASYSLLMVVTILVLQFRIAEGDSSTNDVNQTLHQN